ncbi:MAG: M42 family metallopeptidase, partial [Elusimicrobiaceae bacterium]
ICYNQEMDFKLFKTIAETHGVAGREENIRALAVKLLTPLVDEIRVDALGNVIGLRKGSKKQPRRIMIAAHMDEIGLAVNYIDDKGFVRFIPAGGIDPRTLLAQRVFIHTANGDIPGVIGTKPIHLMDAAEMKQGVGFADLFIDTGMSAAETKKTVQFGDTVTLARDTIEMGDCITSKAIDDRAGVYAIISALRQVKRQESDIYAVFTVQEEIGLKGATVAAFGVEPEIGLAVDCTAAADVPGNSPQNFATSSGGGVAITGRDGRTVSNIKIMRFLKGLAEKHGIAHQIRIANKGGTDASVMQLAREGAAVCTLSIPTRYVHSCVETVRKSDMDSAVALLAAFITDCHSLDCKF